MCTVICHNLYFVGTFTKKFAMLYVHGLFVLAPIEQKQKIIANFQRSVLLLWVLSTPTQHAIK